MIPYTRLLCSSMLASEGRVAYYGCYMLRRGTHFGSDIEQLDKRICVLKWIFQEEPILTDESSCSNRGMCQLLPQSVPKLKQKHPSKNP